MLGPPQAIRLSGEVVKLSLRVFGLSRFLLIRFGFGPYTVDVLYVVVDTTALVLGGVGNHDVVGLAEQHFRVELLALANGAAHHLLAPPPGLRLRPKLVGDVGVDLALLLL